MSKIKKPLILRDFKHKQHGSGGSPSPRLRKSRQDNRPPTADSYALGLLEVSFYVSLLGARTSFATLTYLGSRPAQLKMVRQPHQNGELVEPW